ncbi:hypothetical protein EVAR_25527_1 [Eumeta japonica]|uniref:Uncharacterized protein n=1 Tax=Eumeta variegata TaxID=151549 RepID=A0A4C1VM24_EUMVA|nr:hypothetical protein EVAR_25527_1 [Eumeta japonica]
MDGYDINKLSISLPQTLYLAHTQAGKTELKAMGCGQGKESRVLTIHEAQGLASKKCGNSKNSVEESRNLQQHSTRGRSNHASHRKLYLPYGRELNIKSLERGARRPYIDYGSLVWSIGVCGACEAVGRQGCPTWPVIQRASLNTSLFGSSGHLGVYLQRSRGRTSFVLDVLYTAVFTSQKVAGMYSMFMIHVLDYS